MGIVRLSFYNKSSIDTLIPTIHAVYIKAEIVTLFPNTDLCKYFTKAGTDDSGNGLPTLILNTYNTSEKGTFSHITITM